MSWLTLAKERMARFWQAHPCTLRRGIRSGLPSLQLEDRELRCQEQAFCWMSGVQQHQNDLVGLLLTPSFFIDCSFLRTHELQDQDELPLDAVSKRLGLEAQPGGHIGHLAETRGI